MATLTSPGVLVTVDDESMYAAPTPGTVPLILVATAENKTTSDGSTIAKGTQKQNSDTVFVVSGQKELIDTFGEPVFLSDIEGNPIHGSELNEYGLEAAYSYLGINNRAFVARADIDLGQLQPSVTPPTEDPEDGLYWLDTASTFFGISEWSSSPKSIIGGQPFTNKIPLVISDPAKLVNYAGGDYRPLDGFGSIGDYAIVTADPSNVLYFKTPTIDANRPSTWVVVGSNAWSKSWPTISGTKAVTALTVGDDLIINGTTVAVTAPTLQNLVDNINTANINGAISASIKDNKLVLYHNGNSASGDSIVITAGSTGTLVASAVSDSVLGIAIGTYLNPKLTISKHTQIPEYDSKTAPRPTGSVWIKTTKPNMGANWVVKRFRAATKKWDIISAPLAPTSHAAIAELDPSGGGINIPQGNLYIQYNYEEHNGLDVTPQVANFRLMRRNGVGETTIISKPIAMNTLQAQVYNFEITESVIGSVDLVPATNAIISVSAVGDLTDAFSISAAINAKGLKNIQATVDSLNRVVIKHKLGGEFRIRDTDRMMQAIGFVEYDVKLKTGTANLYKMPDASASSSFPSFVASLWCPLLYVQNSSAPRNPAADGRLWYNTTIDSVDIMVNDGTHWVGYQTLTSPYYSLFPTERTDPNGPIISATIPLTQTDGSPLVMGDLWIDTSDIENYPVIYKFDADLENTPVKDRWTLVDTTDQTTENGIVFADARYNVSGKTSNVPGSIVSLLTSNFVDFDAPDPKLYPKGMLLWNMRRSGFNVKQYRTNYINLTEENIRFGDAPLYSGESMVEYAPDRWVTVSGRDERGVGFFGRKAQRRVVVDALQALVNSNQDLRDDEGRVFNLIACPGYPELIGEMVRLNTDRGETAFVIGDCPSRLPNDSTALFNWGHNVNEATEDGDYGLITENPYLAVFYPWGIASNYQGKNVVVPPSHMMLRTMAKSDNDSYPWFAPAGTTRGVISNADTVGFITSEGEFKPISLNSGQRDMLYEMKVNPLAKFITSTSPMNYGNKTRAKTPSSLDRINVARLVAYLRRRLAVISKPFIFQPNDQMTRNQLKNVIESVMLELVATRAITDYLVVVDSSNNTPARIDRNELWADVAIVPLKAVEFIYIPLKLKNTGAISGTSGA